MSIRAIVLTKSAMRKNGKRGACTTAYDADANRIVRFVSDENGSPLPYNITARFNLLDEIEFDELALCPEGPQTENVYVDVASLRNHGRYNGSPEGLLESISKLYSSNTRFMSESAYKLSSVRQYSHSLEIIKASNLVITQTGGESRSGKASFWIDGKEYDNFSITDPEYDIRGKDTIEWSVGDAYIAVSIPALPFEKDGYYYKFIAAVYPVVESMAVTSFPIEYATDIKKAVSFTASYSGYQPNFAVYGFPKSASKVNVLQHSFVCIMKNILSRSTTVSPSEYLTKAIKPIPSKLRAMTLDAIIRYQFVILSLAEYGLINIGDKTWAFDTDDDQLFEIAVEDLLQWFENLYCLAGKLFQKPEIVFSSDQSAIRITDRTGKNVCRTEKGIIIIDAEDEEQDYYHVSSGKPVVYGIEPNVPDDKRTAMQFLLKNIFGYHEFNQGQTQIIVNLLNRRKTIGILPTGGGKSLCYQFAAILQPGVSFSVCPLMSLEQDQKDNLDELGFTRTGYISSDQSKEEKLNILEKLGNGKYQIIWISPERFQSEDFREKLSSLFNICYAVIDEVHCLSEWGHDFRTSYLTLISTIENYCPEATLVGLTATASQAVLKDLKIEFNIDDQGIKALPSLQRENLTMHVVVTRNKEEALKKLLEDHEMVSPDTLGIVFTVFKDRTGDYDVKPWNLQVLRDIRRIRPDLKATKYHADIPNKREVQEQFKNDEINILSSTKAFGMGINKDDIRYTIHYSLPWSVEAFYQEAGRAGRGEAKRPADCYILYTPEDASVHRETMRLFERSTTPEEIAKIQANCKNQLNDVGNIFFLWTKNNKGVGEDTNDIAAAVKRINQAEKLYDSEGRKYCSIQTGGQLSRDVLELALYRLKLLGFITDWTITWQRYGASFKCYIVDSYSSQVAQECLFRYIRRYDPSFGLPWTSDTEKYKKELENTSLHEFYRYLTVLLEWSYDHIIYSRRRMIYNIKEFCETYQDPVSFRKRIDDFLRVSESGVVLEGIVDSPQDWETWFEVFYDTEVNEGNISKRFVSKSSSEALHETTARYLESYRNVTGLNLAYCLSGALSGRYNVELDHDLMCSVVSDISTVYIANREKILTRIFSFLDEHATSMQDDAVKDLADCIVEVCPEMADKYYRRFKNLTALRILLSKKNEMIKQILGRTLK